MLIWSYYAYTLKLVNGIAYCDSRRDASTKEALEDSNKLVTMNLSTIKLDQILSISKTSCDHRWLGYSDYTTSTSSPSIKTTFVASSKPILVDTSTKCKGPHNVTPRPIQKSLQRLSPILGMYMFVGLVTLRDTRTIIVGIMIMIVGMIGLMILLYL